MNSAQLAFVFPGQGSQKVGMLADIAAAYPIVSDTFSEASDALGYDMWSLIQAGPQEELNLTEKTQPILLTSSVALWRVWQQRSGLKPSVLAGHSLGEFSALVCADALNFTDAVKLVRARGQFMQTAVPVGEGAMAAVLGMDDEQLIQICREASAQGGVVEAVNFNSPGQVVIAGTVAAVDKAIELCKAAGSKRALPLPVSAPFHTSLMRPAGEKLRAAMADLNFSTPSIPVVHNVNAKPESDPEKIKTILFEQIFSPVLWSDCVAYIAQQGITTAVECGPGKVLGGLIKRIDKSVNCFSIEDSAGLDAALSI
ncbi:MAG: malonyl CoA-acyl carrier protein transacylase [Verrucomicrobiaceae bacterium]|nr:malonyl CoA-acyl carrier protein transacylase [Verrucomicrobiaceae bacterium]